MSEILKNIETCRGEDVLAEVSALPQDPHFGSLVNEALDPLKQQALHQAGYDGYSEVIAQHKPYTFASAIIQMKSNLLLLLRALWQFPFGTGTLRSLADMWQHYINRLSGNSEYGIPSRLDRLTDLSSAPALLTDRDMSSGILFDANPMPDGMSFVQLLCSTSAASSVTEIVDNNVGWEMTRAFSDVFVTPALKKAKFKCVQVSLPGTVNITEKYIFHNVSELEDIEMTEFADTTFRGCLLNGSNKVKRLVLPYKFDWWAFKGNVSFISGTLLEELYIPIENWSGGACYHNEIISECSTLKRFIAPYLIRATYCSFFWGCPNIEYVYVPKTVAISRIGYDGNCISNLAHLHTFISGGFQQEYYSGESEETQYGSFKDCPNLIHLEAAQTINASTNIMAWSPTNALDASLDTLVTDEDCHNNLEQFLSNMRQYIILRLENRTSAASLTLTLSPEVYRVVYGLDTDYNVDSNAFTQTTTLGDLSVTTDDLTDTEIATGITISTIYATWLDTYRGAINWNIGHS